MTNITLNQHFTMFQTIADFMEERTNLDTEQACEVAGMLLTQICDNANIEIVPSEKDNDFLLDGLAQVLVDSIADLLDK